MRKTLSKLLVPLAILAANAASLLIQVFIPQFLGPDEYSHFTVLWSYGQLFVVIFFEWMRSSVLRFSEGADIELASRRRRFLMGAYLTTAAFLLGIALLAYALGEIWPIAVWISIALVYSVCQGLFDATQVLSRARFENRKFALSWMSRSVLGLLGAIGFAYLSGSGSYAVIGMALSFSITVLVFNFQYIWRLRFDGLHDHESRRFLFGYGAFLAITSSVTALFPALTRTAALSGLGAEEAGGLLFALDLTQRTISALGMAVNLVVLQRSIRAAEFESSESKQNKLREQMALVAGLILPAGLGFYLIQDSISLLVVPDAYRVTYLESILGACFCAALVSFRSYGIDTLFVVAGKSRNSIIGPSVSLISTLSTIFLWGEIFSYTAKHIVISMMLGLSLGTLATVISARRQVTVVWPLKEFLIVLLACLAMYLGVGLVAIDPGLKKIIVDIIIGGTAYTTVLIALNFVDIRKRVFRF